MLEKNRDDRVADHPCPSALELRTDGLGPRFPRGGLLGDVPMDTLETGLKLAVPKTSNQAHSAKQFFHRPAE
jgi:hypothetical protein